MYSGTVTITPSGGGLSTPVVLTFNNSATPQTFTITPTSNGPVTLTPSNNGSLTDAAAITYATTPGTPTGVVATAGNQEATVTFTAPSSNGGAAIPYYTATASSASTFGPPPTVSRNPRAKITIPTTPTATGTCLGQGACTIVVNGLNNFQSYTFTLTATNIAGTGIDSSASSSVTPNGSFSTATSYTLSGPAYGSVGRHPPTFM